MFGPFMAFRQKEPGGIALGVALFALIALPAGPARAEVPPEMPDCYDFTFSDEGLFTYTYDVLPGYECGAIPVEPGTMVDGDVLDFTFTVVEGQVPNEWGTGSRMGLTTVSEYSQFLGVSLIYDDNICYRVRFRADATGEVDFPATVGTTYRAYVRYEAGYASLDLVDVAAETVVHSDMLAYTPSYFDVMQIGLDYPGEAICGPVHYWWDADNGTAAFCVDRDTGPYLQGWVDDIYVPRCDDPPPVPDPCYTFECWDHGLFDYAYDIMPDYPCAGIPVPGQTLLDGDQIYFEFGVDAGEVPNEWGTGSRVGVTTVDDYAHFLGVSLVYDDNICYRVRFRADGTGESTYVAAVEDEFGALITYDAGTASLELYDLATMHVVYTNALAYTPSYFDVFQIGLDYPGEAHCGPTHFWWDPVSERARFCVDRDTGPYLEGFLDNIYTPGCDDPPPPVDACYLFDTWGEGLFLYEYENMPGYMCAGIPVTGGVPAAGDVLEFRFSLAEMFVPGEWGTGTRMGITSQYTYGFFLGVGIAYDNEQVLLRFSANGNPGEPYELSEDLDYRVRILILEGTAQLQLIVGDEVMHDDCLPYDPHYFNVFQIGIDYPGSPHCGDEHYWWDEGAGTIGFCVDRDAGGPYYLEGWIDEVHTPDCSPLDPNAFFEPPAFVDVSDDAFSFEPADMNNDGIEDMVVCKRWEEEVSVWLGNGDGSFTHNCTVACDGTPVMLLIDDFNNDDNLDVATSNQSNATVGIFLGDGAGCVTPAGSFDGGTSVTGIVSGDFNEDECADLAVMNAITGNSLMRIFLSNCDGTFTEGETYPVGDRPHVHGQVATHINDDEHLDLAIGSANGSEVSIFYGDGTGEFLLKGSYPSGLYGMAHLMEGHFNGDNLIDFAWTSNNSGGYSIYLQQENGTFVVAAYEPEGWERPAGLDVGDLTRDGILDLVICDYDMHHWMIMEGSADGTFTELLPRFPLSNAGLPRIGDYNLDMIPDLAVSMHESDDYNLAVYLGVPFSDAPVDEIESVPVARVLWVAPNPMSYSTVLRFALPSSQPLNLQIYDTNGRVVRDLLRGDHDAGEHTVVWDGADNRGAQVPTGIYYARLSSRSEPLTRRLVMVK
jgi:hypothetical protein